MTLSVASTQTTNDHIAMLKPVEKAKKTETQRLLWKTIKLKNLQEFENALQKMEAGEPTWPVNGQ